MNPIAETMNMDPSRHHEADERSGESRRSISGNGILGNPRDEGSILDVPTTPEAEAWITALRAERIERQKKEHGGGDAIVINEVMRVARVDAERRGSYPLLKVTTGVAALRYRVAANRELRTAITVARWVYSSA